MAQQVNTAAANYINPGLNMFTGELKIPIDNAPEGPIIGVGVIRLNTDTLLQEYWDGTSWVVTGSGASGIISGTYTTTGNGLTANILIPIDLSALTSGQLEALEYTINAVTSSAQGAIRNEAISTGLKIYYDVRPLGTLTYNFTIKLPS